MDIDSLLSGTRFSCYLHVNYLMLANIDLTSELKAKHMSKQVIPGTLKPGKRSKSLVPDDI